MEIQISRLTLRSFIQQAAIAIEEKTNCTGFSADEIDIIERAKKLEAFVCDAPSVASDTKK